MFVANSFSFGIMIRRRDARRGEAPFVHLFSSERGPDAVRPDSVPQVGCVLRYKLYRKDEWMLSEKSASGGACTSNPGRLPGSGGKVMQERTEMRFLHHFSRGRWVDWNEMSGAIVGM